jgi:hypothetical protein
MVVAAGAGEVRRPVPARYIGGVRRRPQLAAVSGGRYPGRIHHFFELRVRDLSGVGDGARPMGLLYVTGSVVAGYPDRQAVTKERSSC